jgi:5-methylcytosine-specific restriction endonuclease McrA
MIMDKKCNKCGITKAIDLFYKNKTRKDGHDTWCKICSNQYSINYYHMHKDKRRKQLNRSRKKRRNENCTVFVTHLLSRNVKRIDCTAKQIVSMFENSPLCSYCGKKLHHTEMSVDHIIPLARGGSKSMDNLCISCVDCNRLKHTKTLEEFIQFLSEYGKRISLLYSQEFRGETGRKGNASVRD